MKRLRPLLTLGLLLAAAPVAAQTATESAAVTKSGTVRVVASATTTVKPDLAEIDLGVTTEKPTAAAATSENARKMEQIVAAMKKEAGQGGEVKTVGFNLGTRYGQPRPNSDQPTVVGYTVTSTVRVRTADVNSVGRILDAAFKLGSNNVQRVAFLLKDQEPAQTEALKQATAKARGRHRHGHGAGPEGGTRADDQRGLRRAAASPGGRGGGPAEDEQGGVDAHRGRHARGGRHRHRRVRAEPLTGAHLAPQA
jgi:uncharacterized protein